MPRTGDVVTRLLDQGEREARGRYLHVHPGDELRLAPTTAGYAPVADWLDAGEPAAASCRCPLHAPAGDQDTPGTAVTPGPAVAAEALSEPPDPAEQARLAELEALKARLAELGD
jgi:hypothetical protein